jgi:Domain of unknown function (DUF4203)
MQDVIVGIMVILAGLVFCFRGYWAMRIVIPVWGGVTGFVLGAALVASGSDDGFLRTAFAWIVGIVVALLFFVLAYLYYEVAVVLAMGGIGFTLGASLMIAIGVDWSWVIALVGIAVGVLLAAIAIIGNLPMIILVILTAGGGASAIVGGLMLLTGKLQTAEITEQGAVTDRLHDDWWWYAIWVVLFIAGVIAQVRATERLWTSVRAEWTADDGKTLRAG